MSVWSFGTSIWMRCCRPLPFAGFSPMHASPWRWKVCSPCGITG